MTKSDSMTLAERLAPYRDSEGVLKKETIQKVLRDFAQLPMPVSEDLNIRDWMLTVRDLIKKDMNPNERLSVYVGHAEHFYEWLRTSKLDAVQNLLSINYGVMMEMCEEKTGKDVYNSSDYQYLFSKRWSPDGDPGFIVHCTGDGGLLYYNLVDARFDPQITLRKLAAVYRKSDEYHPTRDLGKYLAARQEVWIFSYMSFFEPLLSLVA